jgi:hypothetical protein
MIRGQAAPDVWRKSRVRSGGVTMLARRIVRLATAGSVSWCLSVDVTEEAKGRRRQGNYGGAKDDP